MDDRMEKIFRLADEIAKATHSKHIRWMAWEIQHEAAASRFGPSVADAVLGRWPPLQEVPPQ